MSMPNYQETLDYLFSQLPMYQRVGSAAYKANLDNTIALCEAAGNPHQKLKCIHVGGTNGKGSVSHIIASALQEQGYKVGLYTSPHYKDFRERIKINGTYISEEAVVDFVEKYKTVFKAIEPSFFEMTVLMAFEYFVEQQVDYAVIEVGLGGRLDSTNVITPLLSIITNISYDHTDILGDTLEKIATEKAGIIKKGVPVVIGETHPDTYKIFSDKAQQMQAEILFADTAMQLLSVKDDDTFSFQEFEFDSVTAHAEINTITIRTDLMGNYQAMNVRTAYAALQLLISHKLIPLSETALKGISNIRRNTGLLGRFHIAGTSPLTIMDSAHNADGIETLLFEIQQYPFRQLHIVYGTVADKDLTKVLPLLSTHATYYFCKANIPRGLDARQLNEAAYEHDLIGNSYTSVPAAYQAALDAAHPDDLVLVTGSIFVVAEVL